MQDVTNPLQKQSYCNKDFVVIYKEMLDLVKKITNKWDPSISNESDPGVVLLKLNALIADKVNYNTDTAILETFPISVTQSTNARKLFEQLGYYMHWYQGATCNVSLSWTAAAAPESELYGVTYTLPKFATVTDETSTIVYTLVGPAEGVADNEFKVSDLTIRRDGEPIVAKAIQGTPVNFSYNGVYTITYDMLDSNNRLYFPYSDVAENGIFICNEGLNNYNSWVRKNNLAIEDVSSANHFYRFGVSQDNMSCYIEFPVNIEELMVNGLNITYIRTSGEYGNLSANLLVNMYTSVSPIEDTSISISGSTLTINNVTSGAGGKDPESIDDAYRNYKQTVGTFNTLITLRDYFNYVVQSGLVSNGFVCDRTNDIQCVTRVMSTTNGVSQQSAEVTRHQKTKVFDRMYITSSTPKDTGAAVTNRDLATVTCNIFEDDLTAFSLKFYLLKYVKSTDTAATYASSFDMLLPDAIEAVKAYVDSAKVITHDYVDLLPTTTEFPNICMLKNKYPIICRIVPQYSLTKAEKEEVKTNLFKALYNGLSSPKIEFGTEIDLDYVYELIEGCDARIKSVSVDKITYNTYAIVYNGVNYVEIPINSHTQVPTFEYQAWGTEEDAKLNWPVSVTNIKNLYDVFNTWRTNEPTCFDQELNATMSWDFFITHTWSSSTWTHTYNIKPSTYSGARSTVVTLNDAGLSVTQKALTEQNPEPNSRYKIIIPQQDLIREDLYAKSVLAGSTQFLVEDELVDYTVCQIAEKTVDTISKVNPNLTVTLSNPTSASPNANIYKLKDNESVRFYAPNLLDKTTYSSYTRFEALLQNEVPSGTDYRLGANECIFFYWKESSDASEVYKFAGYGEGCIIKPDGFTLSASSRTLIGDDLKTILLQRSVPKQMTYRDVGDMLQTMSNNIADGLGTSYNVLSGTKAVNIREMNNVTLNSKEYYCYWVVNDITSSNKYRLFSGAETVVSGTQSRTLGVGEYFYYTNASATNLVILGSGTKITRTASNNPWDVDVVSSEDIYEQGTAALSQYWFSIPASTTVTIIENQYITVPSNYQIKLTLNDYTILQHQQQALNGYVIENDSSGGTSTPKTLTSHPVVNVSTLINNGRQYFTNLGGTSGTASITFKYTNITGGEWTINDTVVGTSSWATGLSGYGVTLNSADAPTQSATKSYELTLRLSNDWSITINSAGTSMSSFDMFYKTVNDSVWTEIPKINLGAGFTWTAIANLSMNVSSTNKQHLLSNQSLQIYCNDETTVTTTITGQDASIVDTFDGMGINAAPGGNYYWQHLGTYYLLSVDAGATSDIYKTLFVIDYGNTSSMLTTYPTRTGLTLTTSSTQPASGTNIGSKIASQTRYPVTIYTSDSITSAVPGEITTVKIDEDLTRTYATLYSCVEFVTTNSEQVIIYNDNGTIIAKIPSGSGLNESKAVVLSVPTGSYLLPVYCSQSEATYKVWYQAQDAAIPVQLVPINGSTAACVGGREYYFQLPITNSGTRSGYVTTGYVPGTLLINILVGCTKSGTVKLGNLYKYTYADVTSIFPYMTQSAAQTLIMNRMKHYDVQNLYDYTYVVDPDNEITNPLEASTFFDTNHIYNKFTIGQLDTSATSKTTITFAK